MELGILEAGESLDFITTIQVENGAPANMIFYLAWDYSDGIDNLNLEKSIGTNVLWLSDAFWSYHQNGWGETGRDMTVQGLPITLNEIIYEKGLGLHAVSETRMDLNGQFTRFISDVGVDDEISNGAGSVEFQVFIDGVEQFNSGYMDSDSPTQTIDIDVSDVNEIILIIDESTFGIFSDHAYWAGAYLASNSLLGDLNSDGAVNILDIIMTVNCILDFNPQQYCEDADLNNDDSVNILDVITLVNWVLGQG